MSYIVNHAAGDNGIKGNEDVEQSEMRIYDRCDRNHGFRNAEAVHAKTGPVQIEALNL